MIPLSSAIRRGAERSRPCATGYFAGRTADVFGAAALGLPGAQYVEPFWQRIDAQSYAQMCASVLRSLHQSWPHIGQSVRAWPRLAEELEADRLIPRLVPHQTVYRQDIHVSLWKAIADMYAAGAGESREAIAARLARFGL